MRDDIRISWSIDAFLYGSTYLDNLFFPCELIGISKYCYHSFSGLIYDLISFSSLPYSYPDHIYKCAWLLFLLSTLYSFVLLSTLFSSFFTLSHIHYASDTYVLSTLIRTLSALLFPMSAIHHSLRSTGPPRPLPRRQSSRRLVSWMVVLMQA